MIITEAIPFVLPSVAAPGCSAHPWLIITSKDAIAKCQAFKVAMLGSKAYSPQKTSSNNKALPQIAETMKHEVQSIRRDSQRPVSFLDDMVLCTMSVVESWYKDLALEDVETVYRKVFTTALEFGFAGTVEIGGKQLTKWSCVRPALKLQTIKVLQEKCGMDASDVGATLLAVLKEDEGSDSQTTCDNTEDLTIMFETLERTNQDGGFDDLKQFNDSWGGLAQLERHPLFNDMMAQIWSDAKGVDERLIFA